MRGSCVGGVARRRPRTFPHHSKRADVPSNWNAKQTKWGTITNLDVAIETTRELSDSRTLGHSKTDAQRR